MAPDLDGGAAEEDAPVTDDLFATMKQSVIDGEAERAEELARQALSEGVEPLTAINQGLVPGMKTVGEQFSCGEVFVPDLMMAAEAMKKALAVLEPELRARGGEREVLGRAVLGTVKGDIHEIGKSLVGLMLSTGGFEVHDLGVDVPFEAFAAKAKEVDADLVGVSALLTTTMPGQARVIRALDEAGLRPKVKVMVGGAPVSRGWAEEIGADGYSEDALGALEMAKRLVGK
jgi:corrinoid protein of di/trimethylamine methyltransferase